MSDNAVELLRHAMRCALDLGQDDTQALLDRVEAIVRAYDSAKSPEEWLAACSLHTDLEEWVARCTPILTIAFPNPHVRGLPDLGDPDDPTHESSAPVDAGVNASNHDGATSIAAQRWERAAADYFAFPDSPEARAELDAAEEGIRGPNSLFEAPILDARARVFERLEFDSPEFQRELSRLLELSDQEPEGTA